jgi:hypothetical protein
MIKFWRKQGTTRIAVLVISACLILAGSYSLLILFPLHLVTYSQVATPEEVIEVVASSTPDVPAGPPPFVVMHISTPEAVRAIYYSSWAAGSLKFREKLFKLVDDTEVNAVVIDVKDYSGHISFLVEDPELKELGAAEKRIPDIKEFIGQLHDKGVYVIARISSFQDSYLINVHPEWAVKTKEGKVWQDFNGVKWLDAGAEPVWEYLVRIGNEAYSVGFDELNFDYIRYPSDGDLKDVAYSWSNGRTRSEVMRSFFEYLHNSFASTSIPISADLFGLVTSAEDDLGIGQLLTDALPYFDYICPMVYPSHFGKGFLGYPKPATEPYNVVKYSMDKATIKALNASSTPVKLRPWLQAFDLGAIYTPALVRAQMQATYDSGLNSWLLWNAASEYNADALLSKDAPQIPVTPHIPLDVGTSTNLSATSTTPL